MQKLCCTHNKLRKCKSYSHPHNIFKNMFESYRCCCWCRFENKQNLCQRQRDKKKKINETRRDETGWDGTRQKRQTLSFDDLFLFSFSFTKINKQQKVPKEKRPKFHMNGSRRRKRRGCIEGGNELFMFRFWFIFWFWLQDKTPYTRRFTYAHISQLFLGPRVVRKSKLKLAREYIKKWFFTS